MVLLLAGESLRRAEAPEACAAGGTPRRPVRQPVRTSWPLHARHEAQREQCAHFAFGERRASSSGAWAAFRAVSWQDQDHPHHGLAHQRNVQRFSSLASEMREAETPSQAETEEASSTSVPDAPELSANCKPSYPLCHRKFEQYRQIENPGAKLAARRAFSALDYSRSWNSLC